MPAVRDRFESNRSLAAGTYGHATQPSGMEYDDYLDLISDRAVWRYDVARLFADAQTLGAVVEDFADPFRGDAPDAVAGIDALGFVFGTGVALDLGVGFIPIRKADKLPIPEADRLRVELTDYTGGRKALEIDATALRNDSRVLVVDDWMETGAQMAAATTLVERAGATVTGITVLDAEGTKRSRALAAEYDLHTVNPETDLP